MSSLTVSSVGNWVTTVVFAVVVVVDLVVVGDSVVGGTSVPGTSLMAFNNLSMNVSSSTVFSALERSSELSLSVVLSVLPSLTVVVRSLRLKLVVDEVLAVVVPEVGQTGLSRHSLTSV